MKKTTILFATTALLLACNNSPKQTHEEDKNNKSINSEITSNPSSEEQVTKGLDLEKIPQTKVDIGDFPFLNLPKGLEARKGALQKNFDVCFFPIDGVMTPFEGKLYKAGITAIQGEEYSQRYFEKSMEDYLQSIGAVKVYDGEITKEEFERYNKQDPNKGASGDMGYWNERIQLYVIKPQDKGIVLIQFTSNNAGGTLNILQQEALKQTITKVTAEDISKDLVETGKSILYINFDIDQANITKDGQVLVRQISEALQKDRTLKVSIEGHTDNSGDISHNKKLSNDRANAVLNSLVSNGIDKSRLAAKGLGSGNPLFPNDSEENKAKNRRVELVRTN